jgi:hypothetical protein
MLVYNKILKRSKVTVKYWVIAIGWFHCLICGDLQHVYIYIFLHVLCTSYIELVDLWEHSQREDSKLNAISLITFCYQL